ncbi:MAG: hypothetical protein FWB72_01405 [Firmicutes bacterium]|nr:hypothetical protein [Bacillota bacterium]
MLDKKTFAMLETIINLCGDSSHKIIEVDDIVKAFPKKFKIDAQVAKILVNYLIERDYLECKYKDENSFSLMPLPKGRLYSEKEREEKRQKRSYIYVALFAIIGSVIGGFIGTVLANLLF